MLKASLTSVVFLLIAVCLCGVLPLWLDEILQLDDTRLESASQLIANLPSHHPGSAPLGYLPQHAILKLFGYSQLAARLPSAVFSAATVFLVALLARQCGLRHGWLAGLIFAAFPLTLRYAAEGRMYSQALFLSVLSTLLYLRLSKKPHMPIAAAYCLCLTMAAYTQPYAATVGLAHVLWSVRQRQWHAVAFGGAALAIAGAAFLPWLLWSRGAWSEGLTMHAMRFSASWKTPLMIFREVAGAGYWGSGILLFLCGLAFWRSNSLGQYESLLMLMLVVPVIAALGADLAFDYFIASRQFLWILPAVAIVTTAAIESSGRAGWALAGLLLVVCTWQAVRYFTAPHENWEAAANELSRHVEQGACIHPVPADDLRFYRFFRPSLAPRSCDPATTIMVVSPYAGRGLAQLESGRLVASGYEEESRVEVGRSVIIRYRARR